MAGSAELVKNLAHEDAEQKAVIDWTKLMAWRWPALEMLIHYPSGGKRPYGEAGKMKGLGTKAGVPDLILPVPRGQYHGLFIEMKRPDKSKARTSPEQKEWIRMLNEEGFLAVICYGQDEAKETIIDYLDLGEFRWPERS